MKKIDNYPDIHFGVQVESIASKIKNIEQLKLQILSSTNTLFQSMGGDDMAAAEAVGETIASLIISSYRLGYSLGIDLQDMDRRIKNQLEVIDIVDESIVKKDIVALNKKFKHDDFIK